MNSADIDWKSGRIRHWDLDALDERRPLADQRWELKEDLAQVEYPSGLLVDVGWLPEFSAEGSFLVQVVRPNDWAHPAFRERVASVPSLKEQIARAVQFATDAETTDPTWVEPRPKCASRLERVASGHVPPRKASERTWICRFSRVRGYSKPASVRTN
jgi:hypothetical protein